uniref:Serine hydrolase domain-containing protein n=1 Tax=Ananas comosus var. bracteatus TaxID=296719 RepID=A0A6V7P6I9_ANACO|nr:unnamed protein product [Ananas comosus var. bracteatus]
MMLPVSHSSSNATLRGYVVGVPSPSFAERRSRHRHVTVKAGAMSRFEEEEENRRSGEERRRRPRFLCLHGFRTSGDIMRQQVMRKWPAEVTARLDLVFADAPYPAEGKSDVEGMFPPPYYEWFQFDKKFVEYRNFGECLAYIEGLMIKDGPFDGLMGFSQGGILSAALPGLQARVGQYRYPGLALTRVPKVKYLVIMGAIKFQSPEVAEKAYGTKIECPALHFIGEADWLKSYSEALLESFADPFVIRHSKGHTVPRLGEFAVNYQKNLEVMLKFLQKIEDDISLDAAILDVKEKEVCLI